jgi:hypothetical protein
VQSYAARPDASSIPESLRSADINTLQHEALSPRTRPAASAGSAGIGAMAGRATLPSPSSGPALAAQLKEFIQTLEQAERRGQQFLAAKLDQKFLPQMVAAQNHIRPQRDIKVFEASTSESDALRQAIANTTRGNRWRAVVNVERVYGNGAPGHGVAVDVSGGRGKVSVLVVDSAWGCPDTLAGLTAALKGVKNAMLTILNTDTQKDLINCKIFALANAMAMADAGDLMEDLHKKNLRGKIRGTVDTINGVDVTIVRGSDVLDARFFQHTTSKEVFDDLPENIRGPLAESFARNFREMDAGGTRREYNTSIERERLKFLRDALAQCSGPSH